MEFIIKVLQDVSTALFGGSIPIDGTATEITGAIPTVWNWIMTPEVIGVFGIGIAVSLLLFAIGCVKSLFWGV